MKKNQKNARIKKKLKKLGPSSFLSLKREKNWKMRYNMKSVMMSLNIIDNPWQVYRAANSDFLKGLTVC